MSGGDAEAWSHQIASWAWLNCAASHPGRVRASPRSSLSPTLSVLLSQNSSSGTSCQLACILLHSSFLISGFSSHKQILAYVPAELNLHFKHLFLNNNNYCHFWLCQTACRILVPRPGIPPICSAVEAWSLIHWTIVDIPNLFLSDLIPRILSIGSTNYWRSAFLCDEMFPTPPSVSSVSLIWGRDSA